MSKNIWFINQYITTPEIEGEGYRHYYIAKYLKAGTDFTPLLITGSFAHAPYRHNRFWGVYKYVGHDVPTLILKVNKYRASGGIGRILNWVLFTLNLFLLPFLSKKKVPKPDVIILSSLPILPVLNLFFFKLLYPRCKLVFEIRDLWPLSAIEFGGYGKGNLFIRFLEILEKWAYTNSDLIISVLPRADLHIQQILNHSNFNYQWITNGFSLSEDNSNINLEDVISTEIAKDDFKVAYAGTLVMANPLDTVIRVILKSQKKNLKLYILGGGPEKERLQQLANGSEKVIFIDKIPKRYVAAFLKKMDLLYMGKGFKNSKVYEYGTSQLKTFDYFNAKKPIIQALSSKENPVTYSGAGYVVEPENENQLMQKLVYFISLDEKKLREYGIKGYDYLMKNCTYEVISRKFHLALRTLEK